MSYTTNARFMGRPQALWQADCFSYLRKEQANENQDERKSWREQAEVREQNLIGLKFEGPRKGASK